MQRSGNGHKRVKKMDIQEGNMSSYIERIKQSALLNSAVYEEVEADESAMLQAMGVVVLSSIAGGIGSVYQFGLSGIITGAISALASWFVWAYAVYFIGAKILPEPSTEANPGQLLRTLGFASSPGLIRVLGIIQGLGMVVAGDCFALDAGGNGYRRSAGS